MVGLPVATPMRWWLDGRRVKTKDLEIDTSELAAGDTLEIPPIVCFDLTLLNEPLPDIEIGGLSNEAAWDVITAYVDDNLARIPSFDDNREYSQSNSGSNPLLAFMNKLSVKLHAAVEELADREPGSEFEMRLLKSAPNLIATGKVSKLNGSDFTGQKLKQFCLDRLIKNHVTKPESQEAILRLLSQQHQLFLTPLGSGAKPTQWIEVFEKSPFDETRTVAAYQILVEASKEIRLNCGADVNQQRFERDLADFKKYLQFANEHKKLASTTSKQQLKSFLDAAVYGFQEAIDGADQGDKSVYLGTERFVRTRVERILKLVQAQAND